MQVCELRKERDGAEAAAETYDATYCSSIEDLWRVVSDLYSDAVPRRMSSTEQELRDELLFCLLGGFGVAYEHNRSAAGIIPDLDPFSEDWLNEELRENVVRALMLPQFEPRKLDGNLRRYRFPRSKASAIVRARQWLFENAPLFDRLSAISKAKDHRELICECSGIGLKTASWILRNLGLGSDLAIVDIHVLRALSDSRRVPHTIRLPRDYEVAEGAFLKWCAELDASPAAFDLFVWHWQRGGLAP